MNETVLVTGATGFLGRALCSSLNTRGYLVRPAVRRQVRCSVEEVAVGDIGPNTDWTDALVNVHGVVHCAARVHVINERAFDPLEAFKRKYRGNLELS